ncbi:MAG: hypothetical protein Q3971_06795 [Moraxella sp.]|nr:hypothetical protein [Moraxella sp.]
MSFSFVKTVSALPSPLTPNTIYAVRVGAGFDLYVSDMTGAVAHKMNAVQDTTNANLAKSSLRQGAYGDSGVIFHDNNQFIITSNWGKWIRVPALDFNQAGTFTVSFLADKNVSRVGFYADGFYRECQVRALAGGLKLFYVSFTATKIQSHLYIEASKGTIYAHKLEMGNQSTLSDNDIQKAMMAELLVRVERLEQR